MTKRTVESRARDLFFRADKMADRGKLRAAFRLFLEAAKLGDRDSQVRVGYSYDTGSGARKDRSAGLYWYRRAYRRGDACAAHNIGTIWRDDGNWEKALDWFQRALQLGNEGSGIQIAKYYLNVKKDESKAMSYLVRASQSDRMTESSMQEVKHLITLAQKATRR